MTSSAVASRYANALADVVARPGTAADPQQVAALLRQFAGLIASSPDLHNALVTPAVPASRKRAAAGRIADRLGLPRVARNFLFVLIDHRRIAELREIVEAFEVVLDERLGYARADISTAAELGEGQRATLVAQFERLTGKRVRPRFSVEPDLVGGVLARIGSTVYDGTVKGQLRSLQRRLGAE